MRYTGSFFKRKKKGKEEWRDEERKERLIVTTLYPLVIPDITPRSSP